MADRMSPPQQKPPLCAGRMARRRRSERDNARVEEEDQDLEGGEAHLHPYVATIAAYMIILLLPFLLPVPVHAAAQPLTSTSSTVVATTPRVVVTFRNASLNADATPPENTTVVKKYGRRLVLHLRGGNSDELGSNGEGDGHYGWIQEALGGEDQVERVEADALASAWAEGGAYQQEEGVGGGSADASHDDNATGITTADTNTSAPLDLASPATIGERGAVPTPAQLAPVMGGWNLNESEPYALRIGSLRAATGGQGTTVSIVDSGIAAIAAPLLRPASGYDFISSQDYSNKPGQARNPDYTDPGDQGPTCPTPSWHGTKVASITAAIAPGATLTVMRVLGQCGIGFSSDIADAVVWASGGQINGLGANPYPATVISLSLAGRSPCPSYLQSAVNQARSFGATVIVAAGNAAQNTSLYFPANCRGVIAVGASTRQGAPAYYSNWGEALAFSAPGGDAANPIPVLTVSSSASPSLALTYAIGTSFAAPHVAGFMALQASLNVGTGSMVIVPFKQCSDHLNPVCTRGILSLCAWAYQDRTAMIILNTDTNNLPKEAETLPPSNALASGACVAELYEFDWNHINVYNPADPSNPRRVDIQAGTVQGQDTQKTMDCPWPCHVTSFQTCMTGSSARFIRIQCSDGDYRGPFGYAGVCDGVIQTASSQGGFTGITAFAGADINGWIFRSITGAETYIGCNPCQTTYTLNAPVASDGSSRIIISVSMAYDTEHFHAFRFQYAGRRCPGGYYMSTSSYTCESCDRCGTNRFYSGCGGSNAGSCNDCARDCPDLQYRAACGGSSGGWCTWCGECGAGTRFAGCTGGDLWDTRTCPDCDPGTYGGGGRTRSCAQCGAGKYNPNYRGANEAACLLCPAGKYGMVSGGVSASVCQSCGVGKYSPNAGQTAESACLLCPVGTYRSTTGGASSADCLPCGPGTYGDTAGRSSCTSCSAGTYKPVADTGGCTACRAGTYGATVGATSIGSCVQCPKGTCNPTTGGSSIASCAKCAAGQFNTGVEATACAPCAAGKYSTATGLDTVCTNCAAGKYNAITGAASAAQCAGCDAGKYGTGAGLTTCELCTPGKYTGTAGNTACATCAPGTFTTTTGTVSCQSCVAITTCAVGSEYRCIADTGSRCVLCDAIYACEYQTNACFATGSTTTSTPSCLCRPGFEMLPSATTCTGCAQGKFKAVLGSGLCTPFSTPVCPRDQYLLQGTAVADAVCTPCVAAPPNARAVEPAGTCAWACNAGFDNNAP